MHGSSIILAKDELLFLPCTPKRKEILRYFLEQFPQFTMYDKLQSMRMAPANGYYGGNVRLSEFHVASESSSSSVTVSRAAWNETTSRGKGENEKPTGGGYCTKSDEGCYVAARLDALADFFSSQRFGKLCSQTRTNVNTFVRGVFECSGLPCDDRNVVPYVDLILDSAFCSGTQFALQEVCRVPHRFSKVYEATRFDVLGDVQKEWGEACRGSVRKGACRSIRPRDEAHGDEMGESAERATAIRVEKLKGPGFDDGGSCPSGIVWPAQCC